MESTRLAFNAMATRFEIVILDENPVHARAAAEEAQLYQLTNTLVDQALAEFERLNAAYEKAALAAGEEERAAGLLEQIKALELPQVAAAAEQRREQLAELAVAGE